MDPIQFAYFVNRENIWMIKRRSSARFSLKPAQSTIIRNKVGRQHFQRHETIKAQVLGQINFAHSATPEFIDNFVRPDLAPGVLELMITKDDTRILRHRRLLDKINRGIVSKDQRTRFGLQFLIACARLFQKGRALSRRAIKRRL